MFQSTHPHGVRQKHLLGSEISNSFNPRTRTGCDTVGEVRFALFGVSIHAPARGATRRLPSAMRPLYVSIHAPARGATLKGVKDV